MFNQDCHLPSPAELSLLTYKTSGVRVDEKLGKVTAGQPIGVRLDDFSNVCGLAFDRDLSGEGKAGTAALPGSRNGRKISRSPWKAGAEVKMQLVLTSDNGQ